MALIVSAASGNFSAGATWVGGVVPTVGDEARASTGHTITIDVDTTCDEVSNAGTGSFTLASGVTLTANVTNKSTTTSRNCLQFTAASPAVGTIVGNITGGTVSGAVAVAHNSTGELSITGNLLGGSGSIANGCNNNSTGTLTITGNATGGSGSAIGCNNGSTGTLTITGNATGGSATSADGCRNTSTGTLTITGIALGGTSLSSFGVRNISTGTINLGRAKGTAYGPGNTSGLAEAVGAANTGLGVIEIEELEFGQYGMTPTSGTGIRLKKVSTNQAIFTYVDAGAAKTLVDATTGEMPAESDVRSGVSYASGALNGSCAVPDAGSVALGVPVDNTTGNAVLTPEAVWSATTRTLTAGGGISASDVWDYATRTLTSASGPSAVEIRTELDANSTKLANLDASVSSRLADADYVAPTTPPTAAQNASAVRTELSSELTKVSALNTDRLANCATTQIVGTLLAQANS